jgi:hypothetical protein
MQEEKNLRLQSFPQRALMMMVEFWENARLAGQLKQWLTGFEVALNEQIKNQLRGVGRQLGAPASRSQERKTEYSARSNSLRLWAVNEYIN